MIFHPAHRREWLQRGGGLGYTGHLVPELPNLHARFKQVLVQCRRARVTPLVAHRSLPALLRKKLAHTVYKKGVRMIHVLWHFW